MHSSKISIMPIPPLKAGDHFDASGDFETDAMSLSAIYSIDDAPRLADSLQAFCARVGYDRSDMASNLLDAHPDACRMTVSRFMFDCRRSILSHYELMS